MKKEKFIYLLFAGFSVISAHKTRKQAEKEKAKYPQRSQRDLQINKIELQK